jgi:hypothetical protein
MNKPFSEKGNQNMELDAADHITHWLAAQSLTPLCGKPSLMKAMLV